MRIPELNLLPESYRNKRRRSALLPSLLVMIVLAVVSVLSAWWVMDKTVTTVTNSADQKLINLAQGGSSKTIQAQTAEEKRVIADTAKRVEILNNIAKTEISWPKTFALTESLLQKDVSLTGVNYTNQGTGVLVTFSGAAPSTISFADYIEYLRSSKALTKVTVDSFNYNASTSNVAFALSLVLNGNNVGFNSK